MPLAADHDDLRTVSTLRRLFRRPSRRSPRRRANLIGRLRVVLALPVIALVVLVSAWWFGAMRVALVADGPTFQLDRLVVTIPRGTEVPIGRAHLLQPPGESSAELDHVGLIHTPSGELRIRNRAKDRRLSLQRAGGGADGFYADRVELTGGPKGAVTRILVEGREVTVSDAGDDRFDIAVTGIGRFRLSIGITSLRAWLGAGFGWQPSGWVALHQAGPDGTLGKAVDTCAPGGWRETAQRMAQPLMIRWFRHAEMPVLYLGGDVTCRTRNAFQIALPSPKGLDELAITFGTDGKRLFLVPVGRQKRNLVVIERDRPGCPAGAPCRLAQTGLFGTSWLVAGTGDGGGRDRSEIQVSRFVAGRTSYDLTVAPAGDGAWRATIQPRANVPRFSQQECRWFLDRKPKAPDIEDALCPEPVPPPPPGATIAVHPTSPDQLFDRRLREPGLEWMEIASRFVVLACALLVAFRLADPVSGPGRPPSPVASILIRARRIGPVIVSVILAAMPEILARVTPAATPSFATLSFALTIANWAFAGIVLSLVPRTGRWLGLMWAILTGLAAIGAISLATYAGDVGTTRAAGHLVKHKLAFLDLLPPMVLAIVTAQQTVLRPMLASLVLDNRARYAVLRWMAPGALILLFLVWLLFGTQQGLGSFQPVEGGKFWFVVMVGAILVSLERSSRAVTLNPGGLSRAISLLIALAFMLALYAVPFLRSDYSPLLIITATSLVLVLVRFLPDLWRWTRARFRVLSERMHLPMRLRPPIYERPIPLIDWKVRRGTSFATILGATTAALGLAVLAVVVFGGTLFALALRLDPPEWPDTVDQQVAALEASLGIGRRVPIERVMTWIDLRYPDDAASPGAAKARSHVRFRDIGFQVVRSRVEIEDAECGLSPEMKGRVGLPGLGRAPNQAIEQFASAAALLFGLRLDEGGALCQPRERPDTTDPATATTILDPRGAHTIPVAENDFAAAYLIARHGVAAAMLLFAFQFAFVILAIASYVRLVSVKGGDRSDQIVRYLLSILLAGAATLFILQWSLAWSNSLGLIPVMGQPMTWLAAGTSHHLLMALPCSVTILLAMRSMAQPPARRSLRAPPL
ncbi:hypothetical protein ACQVP2_18125 [Methylobacterium aquaticum]|uniref:hypothetical protein n=1 Tax=Methylobacterium aquaticum TaxID=270351 RepID=UPI003D1774D2